MPTKYYISQNTWSVLNKYGDKAVMHAEEWLSYHIRCEKVKEASDWLTTLYELSLLGGFDHYTIH